ncbi:MAG: hypothetical protein HC809_15750, partial [Gammaproteobacteria bacterium]|nr:hypothetical protein [Gammaproteobacteria bacterium]
MMETLYLKRDEDRRVKRGHPWVYSNEIDVARTPLKTQSPGATVGVADARGQVIGIGHVSPANLIAVRILARRGDESGAGLEGVIRERIANAAAHRARHYPATPFYRLVYGEGDGLPGLVVDRFDGACVVQTSTWGMEAAMAEIIAALDETLSPTTIVVKNDAGARALRACRVMWKWCAAIPPSRSSKRARSSRWTWPPARKPAGSTTSGTIDYACWHATPARVCLICTATWARGGCWR